LKILIKEVHNNLNKYDWILVESLKIFILWGLDNFYSQRDY